MLRETVNKIHINFENYSTNVFTFCNIPVLRCPNEDASQKINAFANIETSGQTLAGDTWAPESRQLPLLPEGILVERF